jgi:beta-glucosidase
VAVTLKHFAGHGQPEGGRNIAPLDFGEREFRESHLLPFEAAVTAANAQSLMASYNEWDGIPNHANPWLLTNLLRGEWGFKGYVMSDGGGMDVVYRDHAAALDSAEAGRLCLAAGLDYDLGSRACFRGLAEAVAAGRVSAAAVDRAVRGVLRVKFTCGLFEDPFADPALMERITNCAEHRALALEAAHKAMVLLKNTDRTLPLDSATVRTLAVIGPNAAEIHLGGYSPFPMKGMSVLDGIREFAGDRIKVLYAEGCRITMNKECHWQVNENPLLPDPKEERKHIAEAVKTAKKSDAVVLVLGENELVNREAWSDNHLGDRDGLDLVGLQEELAEAVFKTGKPCVVVLINGRPIALRGLSEKAAALLECWYLGQETGRAVADALFGRVNPSGRLTVTVPRSVGQLPCYYNRKPSRFRNYVLADSSPLYPFGFGLSYTTFAYSDLSVSPPEIQADGTALVTVSVANTGGRTGEETVQLYVRDAVSLPTRPVKELKDFCRIRLTPGETRFVTFTLTPEKLAAFGLDMRRAVQPGRFELMVGTNSEEVLRGTLIVR